MYIYICTQYTSFSELKIQTKEKTFFFHRSSSLWVYVYDDSDDQVPPVYLAKSPVPLRSLATGREIRGKKLLLFQKIIRRIMYINEGRFTSNFICVTYSLYYSLNDVLTDIQMFSQLLLSLQCSTGIPL